MAKHELRVRIILEGPADMDPKSVTERIAATLPEAEVILDNARYAARVEELPPEMLDAILKAEPDPACPDDD